MPKRHLFDTKNSERTREESVQEVRELDRLGQALNQNPFDIPDTLFFGKMDFRAGVGRKGGDGQVMQAENTRIAARGLGIPIPAEIQPTNLLASSQEVAGIIAREQGQQYDISATQINFGQPNNSFGEVRRFAATEDNAGKRGARYERSITSHSEGQLNPTNEYTTLLMDRKFDESDKVVSARVVTITRRGSKAQIDVAYEGELKGKMKDQTSILDLNTGKEQLLPPQRRNKAMLEPGNANPFQELLANTGFRFGADGGTVAPQTAKVRLTAEQGRT